MNKMTKSGIYTDLAFDNSKENYSRELQSIISELEANKLADPTVEVKLSQKQLKHNEEIARRNSLKEFNDTIERPENMSEERKKRKAMKSNSRVIKVRNWYASSIPLIDDIPAL